MRSKFHARPVNAAFFFPMVDEEDYFLALVVRNGAKKSSGVDEKRDDGELVWKMFKSFGRSLWGCGEHLIGSGWRQSPGFYVENLNDELVSVEMIIIKNYGLRDKMLRVSPVETDPKGPYTVLNKKGQSSVTLHFWKMPLDMQGINKKASKRWSPLIGMPLSLLDSIK